MKPLKLIMQAFGSYGKKTLIDFEEPNQNLFLITGDTGAGKTTIFDAIVFALYGEASSTANKKDGVILQSQFTNFDIEPFVELEFSEGYGENSAIYTIKRIPRHLKTITRGTAKGVGTREIGSSVTLTMPDGTEYPQKEVNKKLEEIIGLTKSQFMQVAMIAQGEFMELLRAKSDDKKLIFRKLFHTELFQNIVDELNNRKRAKEKEIAIIKTECQTVVTRVVVPEEYEQAETLSDLAEKVKNGELVVLEQFLEELKILCDCLKDEKEKAEQIYSESSKVRDTKRDAYTNAENLLKFFVQLDKAEADLAECKSKENEIKAAVALIEQLRAAYEIQTEYERYKEAEKRVTDTQTALKQQQDVLPELEKAVKETSERESELKNLYDQELANFSKISEKVDRALELFEKIKTEKKELEKKNKNLKSAEDNAESERKKLAELESQEENWKKQVENLQDAELQLTQWRVDSEEASNLKEEAAKLVKSQQEVEQQKSKAEQSKKDYASAREQYEVKNREYEGKRQAFLDAQAGFLAKKLEPGKPCPVCGSLEHPNPCRWEEEHTNLSEEVIETLRKEAEQLREKQEKFAAESKSSKDVFTEKEKLQEELFQKLRQRMEKHISDIPEPFVLNTAQKLIENWAQSVQVRGQELERNVQKLKEIQESLRGVDGKKNELRAKAEEASESVADAKAAFEGSRATLQSLENAKDYPTETAAKDARNQAEIKKKEQDLVYKAAQKASTDAKEKKDHGETLIRKYIQELPELEEQCRLRKEAYENGLRQKKLSEVDWKDLTEQYAREKADALQKDVNEYNSKLAVAQNQKASALEAIGDQMRPVIEDVRKELEEAEEKRKNAESIYEKCKEDYKVNSEVYASLAPRMDIRQKTVEAHAKLDSLYRLLSGNVSGSRMDLETYVQRYYLEKILYAANRRFQDMSAGQFELRMVDVEKAGEGKNRGLDLMVYSNVTGKEREVRTLSGGESFMAALSLALGMADQIQENSAAINLDIMFIDEGFGSLDEHSRNQAVKVLLEMAEGSKLIGIISHVTELKQEIEDQLLVRKDESGSHVRWEIS